MVNLFKCEWQRLYSKKITWLCFALIPILLIGEAKLFLNHNLTLDGSSFKFVWSYNFPVMVFQDSLAFIINLVLILLIVLSVTDEFRSGSIRMVLIRPIKKVQVFYVKFLVILLTMILFLVTFFIMAYIVGFIAFPKTTNITMVYWHDTFTPMDVFKYTLKAYFIGFLTLVALSSVTFFISIISKSVIVALCSNFAIIILGSLLPQILRIIVGKDSVLFVKLQWLLIPQLQTEAIPTILGENSYLSWYTYGVIFSYILLFIIINYLIYLKSDTLV